MTEDAPLSLDTPVPHATTNEPVPFMSNPFPVSGSRIDQTEGEEVTPLWLITFTDTIALMLTFFVMMYAMSVPQEVMYKEVSEALSGQSSENVSKPYHSGAEDTINIDKVSTTKALDLSYLKSIVSEVLVAENLKNINVIQRKNTLIISMPSDLLFEPGRAELKKEPERILNTLSAALRHIRNRVEIVGHTDPRPLEGSKEGRYNTNWALSLARAGVVARVLRLGGYEHPLMFKGVASAQFEEMPETIAQDERYERARRVDIIIMNDEGTRKPLFTLE